MTALVIAPSGVRRAYLPSMAGGVDQVIRVSTAAVVLAVAGIAAYVSYWHAYAVVREYGEVGVTAHLEPVTIDGLVYASSMVVLYAARHQLPVPRLARWLLALGIVATLAANMAQGWSHGPGGMLVAAWPAVALVGSYELLVWMIRQAAADGRADLLPAADQRVLQPDQPGASPRSGVVQVTDAGPGSEHGPAARADRTKGPSPELPDRPAREADINAAAVAAYRASLKSGLPLSERKLARMFGKTSRRWARNRIADARQASAVPA
jgi:hypothetical protein